jgi:hypothetical protein
MQIIFSLKDQSCVNFIIIIIFFSCGFSTLEWDLGQVYVRRHFLTPPQNVDSYNKRVMSLVCCEAQVGIHSSTVYLKEHVDLLSCHIVDHACSGLCTENVFFRLSLISVDRCVREGYIGFSAFEQSCTYKLTAYSDAP